MKLEDIEKLFDDDYPPVCDNFWVLAILLLVLTNINKTSDTIVNIYLNGELEGE